MAMFEAARKMARGRGDDDRHEARHGDDPRLGVDQHFNKSIAETMQKNIKTVGLPKWDANDITLAKGLQKELGVRESGLDTTVNRIGAPNPNAAPHGRRLRRHRRRVVERADGHAALSVEHPRRPGSQLGQRDRDGDADRAQGRVAGAKVQALTLLDMLPDAEGVADAWDYFNNVQTKDRKYIPFIRPNDQPAIWLNAEIMAKYRDEMRKYYYDPTKFKTYLEQLGIKYPTVRGVAQ